MHAISCLATLFSLQNGRLHENEREERKKNQVCHKI